MVTLEVSTIIYGFISVVLAVLGVLLIRTLKDYDDRHERAEKRDAAMDEKLNGMRSEFDRLVGEHNTINCRSKVRK